MNPSEEQVQTLLVLTNGEVPVVNQVLSGFRLELPSGFSVPFGNAWKSKSLADAVDQMIEGLTRYYGEVEANEEGLSIFEQVVAANAQRAEEAKRTPLDWASIAWSSVLNATPVHHEGTFQYRLDMGVSIISDLIEETLEDGDDYDLWAALDFTGQVVLALAEDDEASLSQDVLLSSIYDLVGLIEDPSDEEGDWVDSLEG